MPSTYAHYTFGQKVIEKVEPKIKELISNNIDLYNIGLHGPDILFYYKPLNSNRINKIGYSLHEKIAYDFFYNARKVIRKSKEEEASCAYILGFICHYMLDSECHGYIGEKIKETGVSHAEIEVEFDRMLMVEQGKNPLKTNLTTHIKPYTQYAQCISEFYDNITPEDIRKSLKSMKFYNNLLLAPGKVKRNIIYNMLRIMGKYEQMHGLIVNYEPNPNCLDSCKELKKRYVNGILSAALLINEYYKDIHCDKDLNSRFNRNFE